MARRLVLRDGKSLFACIISGLFACWASAESAWAWPAAAFTEEAFSRGLNYYIPPPTSLGTNPNGSGVALVDLDNDGDLDVVLIAASSGQIGIFENDGTGHFINRSATSGLPTLSRGSSVAVADFDGDHDLDLFIGDFFGATILARNDGGFHFTNICGPSGLIAT